MRTLRLGDNFFRHASQVVVSRAERTSRERCARLPLGDSLEFECPTPFSIQGCLELSENAVTSSHKLRKAKRKEDKQEKESASLPEPEKDDKSPDMS